MPKYKYKAKNEMGKIVKGTMEVADEKALYQFLKSEGKYLISAVDTEGEKKSQGKIKTKVLIDFCRQLGALLDAGVTLVRALNIIADEEGLDPRYKMIYNSILALIRQGIPLSEAMEQQGNAFPVLLISMIRSAEANGNIDQTSKRMANHYEKEQKLNGKVTSAMVYPIILSVLLVIVIIFVLTYMVPQFDDIFSSMETLPLPTVILLGISDGLKNHWIAVIIVIAVVVTMFRLLLRVPTVRLTRDMIKLKIPLVGKLLRRIYTARFARTLSSLYGSGLPIVTALQIGKSTIGNLYIESQFEAVIAKVRAGEALSASLSEIDGFIRKLASTILVGEETGSLDDMLDSTAESLDYEAEKALEKMVSLLEPLLIIIMGLVIGFVVVAVILPVYQSYSSIGQGM